MSCLCDSIHVFAGCGLDVLCLVDFSHCPMYSTQHKSFATFKRLNKVNSHEVGFMQISFTQTHKIISQFLARSSVIHTYISMVLKLLLTCRYFCI